jgi:transposase
MNDAVIHFTLSLSGGFGMMGTQAAPAQLFYDFCLENHVPRDHLLRRVDHFLDLATTRSALKPFYSTMGRPSIDPDLMMRMLIVGYCMGIRSERRLCEEVHLNLAYRWFCKLGLDGKVPDHSTFSRNRHGRFRDSDILRHLLETVVQRCIAEGLVGGEGFAVDASLIAADANKQRSLPADRWQPESASGEVSRAVREYLAKLDDAAFGAASESTPKFISCADPAAQWTGANKGHAFFAYADNYLIDTDNAIILDVEASRAIRQAEVGASRTMIDRTQTLFGLTPDWVAADAAYGSAFNLAWLVKERNITPCIPVFDKSNRTEGTFSRSDFTFDAEANRYTCPAGKHLVQFRRTYSTPRSGITKDGTRLSRASKRDCTQCDLKARCCPNMDHRKVPRDVDEDARDVAREIAKTPKYELARHRRKKVEMLFAHLKRILHLHRLRLRGPSGARDEFLLAATAQNLRKLAKLRPIDVPTTLAVS